MTAVATFLHPAWLALAALLALGWWLLPQVRRDDGWRRLVDAPLLLAMRTLARRQGESAGLRARPLPLLLAALVCLGLAGPALKRSGVDAYRNLSGVVLIVDLSPSMLAGDGAPTRLDQAKAALRGLLRATAGEQVALIGFAGDAYLLAPFNADAEANLALVEVLAPEIMPEAGSRPAAALQLASALFARAGLLQRRLVLISDGAGIDADAMAAATALGRDGIGVSVLGVGSVAGAPPAGQATPLLRADADALSRLAIAAGGASGWLAGNGTVTALPAGGRSGSPGDAVAALLEATPPGWQAQAHWLALALLPLALLLFRRRR